MRPFSLPIRKKVVSPQYIIERILARVPPGEPKEQKSIQTRLSTTSSDAESPRRCQNLNPRKMKTSGQTTRENGYQKNTKQLLRAELKQGRYPPGGQAKHLESTLKQSLKQCNKAADSWATTAWKHRLVATEAGGARFTNSYTSIPKAATRR